MRTMVLDGARVIICDEQCTIAGAITIRGGRVLAVGDSDAIRALAGPESARSNPVITPTSSSTATC